MLASKRALLYQVNSSLSLTRSNYASTLSSIPHKNQQVEGTTTTPEESLGKLYAADQGRISEVDHSKATGGRKGSHRRREEDTERKMEETAENVEHMVKAAAVGVMETGLKVGKIAKHAMDGMWEIAEKTTETVRDSVADDRGHRRQQNKSDRDSVGDDRGHRPQQTSFEDWTSSGSDKFVDDLRRKAGGYDLKHRQ